jgi:RNA ligase (TIGR02306 family)
MEERKLATIRRIKEIKPIEGADNIVLATVDGWNVIVRKDENYHEGDLVIYAEVDSFFPVKPEFEFLRRSSYKKLVDGTEGFRLKTCKMKGVISQGLIFLFL